MATTTKINGTLMVFVKDGVSIAWSTNVSISGNTAEIDTTNKDSGGNYEMLPGLRDWTASCDFLASVVPTTGNLAIIYAAWLAGTALNVAVTTDVSGDFYMNGTCYITSWNADAPTEDKVTGSFTVKGSGALTGSTKT